MINVFYYSIAGKKSNDTVTTLIQQFVDSPYTPSADVNVLKHCLEVALNGTYPSREYFLMFYPEPELTYRSLAEIVTYCKSVLDFNKKQYLQKRVISAINESSTSSEFLSKLDILVQSNSITVDSEDISQWEPQTYKHQLERPTTKGFFCGVPEVDSITNGFQPGNIASVCGFTSHGKSTFCVSQVFKNVREGKKGVLVSLELAPELAWLQFQARYLYEVKGLQVTTTDLLQRKLSSDLEEKVLEYDNDFREDICKNLIIVDESFFPKQVILNHQSIARKLSFLDKALGGLDFVVFDHVGQFELLFPDQGNNIIKQLQTFTKTYLNVNGVRPVTIFAVQCNREGEKRSRKRNGVYDLQAISDLNEVERSSSYIIFMYTSEEMKIVQETKVMMAKNRLGPTLPEPVTVSFNPAVCAVGSTVEQITMSESDFSSLGSFGDIEFGDDDVF